MASLVGTTTNMCGGGLGAAKLLAKTLRQTATGTTTMPPGFTATIRKLDTFCLPNKVTGSASDQSMAKAMIEAWRRDGIFQVAMTPQQQLLYRNANSASRSFFQRKSKDKLACVDEKSYAGYVASGEEITSGVADYSEIFTVTKDLQEDDQRVACQWPCHGPCPWPDQGMKSNVGRYMENLSQSGDRLLELVELGLGVPKASMKQYTEDGWHHMRVLRFPSRDRTNGKGKEGRGIGAHTDYGLLVMGAQDQVGGLFIRPPHHDDDYANWEEGAAGMREDEPGWVYVPPVPGVLTVFPGDMMQYMTGGHLRSTPHKVGLNTSERFAFAYFHEPNFASVVQPLPGYDQGKQGGGGDGIHYGTHFTNMCLRNYPERTTTKKLLRDDRCKMLAMPQLRRLTETGRPGRVEAGTAEAGTAMRWIAL